jgi:hypothetical protein
VTVRRSSHFNSIQRYSHSQHPLSDKQNSDITLPRLLYQQTTCRLNPLPPIAPRAAPLSRMPRHDNNHLGPHSRPRRWTRRYSSTLPRLEVRALWALVRVVLPNLGATRPLRHSTNAPTVNATQNSTWEVLDGGPRHSIKYRGLPSLATNSEGAKDPSTEARASWASD